MKKVLPWIALLLCAALLAAIIFGIFFFLNIAKADQPQTEPQAVDAYFADAWEGFRLVSYDSAQVSVVLEKTLNVTFEQACSFGKESYEDLALGHVQTMQIMRSGCMASCGVALKLVTVKGISSDGQVIYTVTSDGALTACWQEN